MFKSVLLGTLILSASAQIDNRTIEAGQGALIPITTIRGAKTGPTIALIAGNHGYEYTPIIALQRLRGMIEPAKLSGTVILVHVANTPSFLGRTIYFSPLDGKNLNRVYPGKPEGTASERIAYAITKQVIEKADYVFDLHCGDGNESLRPYVYQMVTGNSKLDDDIAKLALSFGLDHIVVDRGRPTDPEKSLYCSTTATTRRKPAITVESGFLGTLDETSIQQIVAGVMSSMRHLKMLEGVPIRVPHPVYLDPAVVVISPATGILYPHVQRDERVKKGDVLAHVTDYFGRKLDEVRSPLDGLVLYIVVTPPITRDQPVAFIGSPKN